MRQMLSPVFLIRQEKLRRLIALLSLLLEFTLHAPSLQAALQVSIENGFETSAPLEAGFIRVRLANTGTVPQQTTIEMRSAALKQNVELPPNSRKEIPLYCPEPGPVIVSTHGQQITRQDVGFQSAGATVLVVTPRETGLRFLEREGLSTFAGHHPFSGGQAIPLTVYSVAPDQLPPAWFAYPNGPLLLVIHPGGFDLATQEQRDALRLVASTRANVVLVSEGKVNAFRGTPVEHLLPGIETSVVSYNEWLLDFGGTSMEPSALTVLEPADDAVTSLTTSMGVPLIVQREHSGRTVTYLPFDYSAPPLRSWKSSRFWQALIPFPAISQSEIAERLGSHLMSLDRERRVAEPPRNWVLGAVFLVLLFGYAAAVAGTKQLRASPGNYRHWLMGPLLLLGAFLLAAALRWGIHQNSFNQFETALLVPIGDNAHQRIGHTGFTGPGKLENIASLPKSLLFMPEDPNRLLWGSIQFGSQMPPLLSKAVLHKRGLLTLPFRDLTPTSSSLQIEMPPPDPAQTGVAPVLINGSEWEVKDLHLFVNGQYARLGDLAPGESRREQKSFVSPQRANTSLQGLLSSAVPVRPSFEERVVTTARQLSTSNFAFALGEITLPPILPGTRETHHYLLVPVELR